MSRDRLRQALEQQRQGRAEAAEVAYRQVLDREPENAEALHLLGLLYSQRGDCRQAVELLRRSVTLLPRVPDFRSNLAGVLTRLGLTDEAAAHLREALALEPGHAEANHNLAVILERGGDPRRAADYYRRAIAARPDYAEAHNHLGNALRASGRLDDAVAAHKAALRLRPDYAQAYNNLAATVGEQGRAADVVECYRRAAALQPASAAAHSDLLFAMLHGESYDAPTLFQQHRRWALRHAARLYPPAPDSPESPGYPDYPNDRSPGRPLRVGYVSGDFREHTCARFIAPVLAHHARGEFAAVCYSDVAQPDAITTRLRRSVDAWRDVAGLTDGRVAELVRDDRIDVLVDLTGHMGGNRMTLFARKPAPVQAAYLGYPHSTGLETMDWRITDAVCDPPGMTEAYHTERLMRLPGCAWCYDPLTASADDPPANDPPAASTGRVTFGCLNRLTKVTPGMARLWARVLSALPGSRLLALAAGGESNRAARALFERNGVPGPSLELVAKRPRDAYLELFHRVDLHLDTHPYNGMTTTCDALWMGVPTVSLAGQSHVSRVGASLLSAVGLDAPCVADTPESYVRKAAALAADLDGLSSLRTGLRGALLHSPLADGAGLTRRLEAAYRVMWAAWCESVKSPTSP